jgi:hypothetical protein
MKKWRKRDKRYNNYSNNYLQKYSDSMISGFAVIAILLVTYLT